MSVDRSLKVKAGLLRQRNVWTRAERLEALSKTRRWSEGDDVLGLPKVRTSFKAKGKKKKGKKKDDDET
jgi:small basic protein (TIGR04137 family)